MRLGKNIVAKFGEFHPILLKTMDINIKVYGCYSTPPEEVPEDYVLIEVIDMLTVNKEYVYRGWMISSSPDITPLEHPIYDLWLVDCKIDKTS